MSKELLPESVKELNEEIVRARTKFPGNRFLFSALIEEVGEAADEYAWPTGETAQSIRERRKMELLQVACVAMRLYEEDDPAYPHGRHSITKAMAMLGRLVKATLQRRSRDERAMDADSVIAWVDGAINDDDTYDSLTDAESKA